MEMEHKTIFTMTKGKMVSMTTTWFMWSLLKVDCFDRVLYISLHRYDNGGFFPGTDDANFDKSGSGLGEGYNINIPWNKVSPMVKYEFLIDFRYILYFVLLR